ncbi:MAG: hypothetical protein M1120_01035 [Patescibacteria group bacterium]|nr:hypothetical protein [Patescibacteria group bacterium]
MAIISIPVFGKNISNLSVKSEFLVEEGEKVSTNQTLAVVYEYETAEINLARDLKIKGGEIGEFLLKKKGEKVNAGDNIAVKKNLFGTRILKSPVTGLIYGLDKSGLMQIHVIIKSREIKSPVEGTVSDKNGGEISLKFNGEEVEGVFGLGQGRGLLKEAGHNQDLVDFYSLDKEFKNCIIIGRSWNGECVAKARALGSGIIGTDFSRYPEIASFKKENDFGILEVGPENYHQLLGLLHKQVYLAGDLKKLIYQL